MLKNKLFKPFFYTFLIVGMVEISGNVFHVLYNLSWFDMVMHSLGGFFVSLSAILFYTEKQNQYFSYGQLLLIGVSSAFIVGLLWEIFELYFGITSLYSPDYWGDNGMDLTMDLFGGFTAVLYSYLKLNE